MLRRIKKEAIEHRKGKGKSGHKRLRIKLYREQGAKRKLGWMDDRESCVAETKKGKDTDKKRGRRKRKRWVQEIQVHIPRA